MKEGDTVRYSGYALRPLRDYWLGCGRHEQKSAAKDELDRKTAMRGRVLKVNKVGADVQWDNGSQSSTMSHLLEVVA